MLSLFGYFFYLVTAFATVMVLLFDVINATKSTSLSSPMALQAIAAATIKNRPQSVALATNEVFADPVSRQDTKKLSVAKSMPGASKAYTDCAP
jgi:hypothetical protein